MIVVTNDNSTGNDAIICDESVGTSIEDLEGKTIAAEAGVVDHFLLLQGLDSVGLTEDDIDFRGVLTADAAAAASPTVSSTASACSPPSRSPPSSGPARTCCSTAPTSPAPSPTTSS